VILSKQHTALRDHVLVEEVLFIFEVFLIAAVSYRINHLSPD
jgi:hypothetical protein